MERVQRIAAHLDPQILQPQVAHITASPTAGPGSVKKVAVLGAAGGIGQPLSLLMKLNPLVRELSLYDVVPHTAGVAVDVSHVDTGAKVKHYVGAEQLPQALYGCDLVLIPAGVPRKPGMTRDDLFNINAGIVKTLVEGVSQYCPQAWIGIISNPVNSTVPIAAEVLKRAGVFNPTKLFGVTTLDVVRAVAFVSERLGVDPETVEIPVIGGHAGATILPLLSQAYPRLHLTEEEARQMTVRIQDAGTEVVKAKAGSGSATLSMAYAAAKFGDSCLKAMDGQPIRLCAYVASSLTEVPYFASPLLLGRNGIEEYLPLGALNAWETQSLNAMKPELLDSIRKGIEFVARK